MILMEKHMQRPGGETVQGSQHTDLEVENGNEDDGERRGWRRQWLSHPARPGKPYGRVWTSGKPLKVSSKDATRSGTLSGKLCGNNLPAKGPRSVEAVTAPAPFTNRLICLKRLWRHLISEKLLFLEIKILFFFLPPTV